MSDDRPAILMLDKAMERYGITRDEVNPLIAMKLAVVLDDTTGDDDWCTCHRDHTCEEHKDHECLPLQPVADSSDEQSSCDAPQTGLPDSAQR